MHMSGCAVVLVCIITDKAAGAAWLLTLSYSAPGFCRPDYAYRPDGKGSLLLYDLRWTKELGGMLTATHPPVSWDNLRVLASSRCP